MTRHRVVDRHRASVTARHEQSAVSVQGQSDGGPSGAAGHQDLHGAGLDIAAGDRAVDGATDVEVSRRRVVGHPFREATPSRKGEDPTAGDWGGGQDGLLRRRGGCGHRGLLSRRHSSYGAASEERKQDKDQTDDGRDKHGSSLL